MDGLAIAAVLNELRPALEGAFIRTAYQPTRDTLVFRISGARPLRLLISPKAASLHLTERPIANPETPSGFAMLLRKHLRGGRIASIRQHGWDRVVTLIAERRVGSRIETVELVCELIGLRGNVLIVKEGVIVGAFRADLRSRLGSPYAPLDPQEKINPESITVADCTRFLASDKPAAALAREIDGMGKETARDVLAMAEEADAGGISAERLLAAMDSIVGCVSDPKPHVDGESGRPLFYPMAGATPVGSMSEAFDRAAEQTVSPEDASETRAVRSHLQRVLGRASRTAARLRGWLGEAEQADALQLEADLILTYRIDIGPRASSASLVDPATGEAVEVSLDPSMSAVDNAQRRYRRARRLRRGRAQVEARLRRIEQEIREVEGGLQALEAGDPLPLEAASHLPSRAPSEKEPPRPQTRQLNIGGYDVFVGRSAQDNDRLLQAAAPDDVWMHARGVPGSHVIVRRRGTGEIPHDVIERAAVLAARHSKAGGERKVAVTVAAAKHVHKPKGAAPGLAIVRQESTLTVRLDS